MPQWCVFFNGLTVLWYFFFMAQNLPDFFLTPPRKSFLILLLSLDKQAFRFFTYGINLTNPIAVAYCEALLSTPAMREWEADAFAESGSIPMYDAHVEKLGGVRRK